MGVNRMEQRDMQVRESVLKMIYGLEKELKDNEVLTRGAAIC